MLSKDIFNACRLQRRDDFILLFLSPLFGENSLVVQSGSNGLKPPFKYHFNRTRFGSLFRELNQVDKDMFGGWLNNH